MTDRELVFLIAARMSSVVTASFPSANAHSTASFTTPSISAPLYPSVFATRSDSLILAISCFRRFAMWISKIFLRSSLVGNPTKNISSNRPFRRSSGGSLVMSLAVATTKAALVFSCIHVRNVPEQTGRYLVSAFRAHAGKRFFQLVHPQYAGGRWLPAR